VRRGHEGFPQTEGVSYIYAEAYATGELKKHGTLALTTEGVPVIALAAQPESSRMNGSTRKQVD